MKWFAILTAIISLSLAIYLWIKASKDIKKLDEIQENLKKIVQNYEEKNS